MQKLPRSGLLQEPCLHAPEGRRGCHLFERGIKKSIIEKARKRELGIFLFFRFRQSTPSSGSAAAAVPERAPEAGAPRGTPSRGRRARSLAERKRPASAAAPGCASAPASVEAVDLVVEGGERLLLDGLHGDRVRAAAQLREGRPALAAFLQHLPVLEMPDVGHRLLRHALDLALLLDGLGALPRARSGPSRSPWTCSNRAAPFRFASAMA